MPGRRAILVACAAGPLALALAGCGGGGGAQIARRSGSKLVLLPSDLPPGFSQFDGGRQSSIDVQRGPRADTARFGRIDGWKSRFRRHGSQATAGPLVVESRADLFKNDGGAKHDLGAYRKQFELTAAATSTAKVVDAPKLADDTVALTQSQGTGRFGVRFYTIAWRDGNATASVSANGFAGKITLADVVPIARAQERRIAAQKR